MGKRRGSLERNLEESSFFSRTAESLIMGLDLTSAPLGMWNRGLLLDGWGTFFRDDVGRTDEGWGTTGGVRRVREAARGRAWPNARGWGGGGGGMGYGAAALGSAWISASTAITFHSEQLAHNGYSGARSPSDRTRRPQVDPAGVPRHNKEATIHLRGGRMARCWRCDDARQQSVLQRGGFLRWKVGLQ